MLSNMQATKFLASSAFAVDLLSVGRRADWQVCQEGCNPFPDRCHVERLSRSPSGEWYHREQSVAYLEKERYGICYTPPAVFVLHLQV